jgi:hypothetical protein
VDLLVGFGTPNPSDAMFDEANRVIATLSIEWKRTPTEDCQVLNEGVPSFPKFGEDDRPRGAAGERFQILGAGIYGPSSVLSFSGRTRPARAVSPHLQRSRPAATSRLPSPSLRSSRGAIGCHPKLRR